MRKNYNNVDANLNKKETKLLACSNCKRGTYITATRHDFQYGKFKCPQCGAIQSGKNMRKDYRNVDAKKIFDKSLKNKYF